MSESINNAGIETPFVASDAPKSLELTAYQGGQAVVREKRVVQLPAGTSRLAFEGLPQQFVQGSLTVVSVDGKGKFKLGPISYRPASLTVQAILAKSVGRKITLIENTAQGANHIRGVLRYLLGNQAVLEQADGTALVVPLTTKYELPDGLPEGMTAKPSLLMEPSVSNEGQFGINILYETEGLTWGSRYEAFYDSSAEKLNRLTCWVDLTNASGARLADAKFKLIAQSNYGNGRRSAARGMQPMALAAAAPGGGGGFESADFAAEGAQSESVGEQKLYVLPDTLTLEEGESKQAVLVMADNVPVTPEFYLNAGYYQDRGLNKHEDAPKEGIYVRLRLVNDKKSNLGIALPPGAVNVFEPDSSGSLQKTDGSSIGHVAQDEPFKLTLRNASKDLKATRCLVDWKQDPEPEEAAEEPVLRPQAAGKKKAEKKPAPRYREETRELCINNYKDRDVEVQVTENLPNECTFLTHSDHFTEEAKQSGALTVKVPAKGKATLSYRIKWRIA